MGSGVSLDQEQLAQLWDEVKTLKNSLTEAEANARELERLHEYESAEFVFSAIMTPEIINVFASTS